MWHKLTLAFFDFIGSYCLMVLLPSKRIAPEEREELERLCRLMREEHDTVKLAELVRQLHELLEKGQSEIVKRPMR